jgi:hypothetical protein
VRGWGGEHEEVLLSMINQKTILTFCEMDPKGCRTKDISFVGAWNKINEEYVPRWKMNYIMRAKRIVAKNAKIIVVR